jgi:6-phosphogluconolactonase
MAHHVNKNILILDDLEAVSRKAASIFVERARERTERGERFRVALSGGATPKRLYELLSTRHRGDVKWEMCDAFFGDERCVPPDSQDSNFRMASEALLKHVPAVAHRIKGELPPDDAARAYEAEIRASMGDDPRFDLVVLGLGPDGHVASLFPGSPLLREEGGVVRAVHVEDMGKWRVTLTLAAINRARHVLFLVSGKSKAQALKEIVVDEQPFLPGTLVQPAEGEMTWLVDRKAAEGLGDMLLA